MIPRLITCSESKFSSTDVCLRGNLNDGVKNKQNRVLRIGLNLKQRVQDLAVLLAFMLEVVNKFKGLKIMVILFPAK